MTKRRNRGNPLKTLGLFVGHMVSATVMFLVVLLLSALTTQVTDWVETWCTDRFLLMTMRLISDALLITDGLLLLWTAVWSVFAAFGYEPRFLRGNRRRKPRGRKNQ